MDRIDHIVLLGDSILDNRAYTDGGPDVTTHLRGMVDARVTLLAVDGSTTAEVPHQIRRVPSDATRIVLSVGGNDALVNIGVLERRAGSLFEALEELMDVIEPFEESYDGVLRRVLSVGLPTTVCTIYNGAFEAPREQRVVSAALRMFNDAIIQRACDHGVPVIDLRRVCTEPGHYWNPIEPNSEGGRRIAMAIRDSLEASPDDRTWIWPSGRA